MLTTESVVRCIEENAEKTHPGLILAAFEEKTHKGAAIDFVQIGKAARKRYDEEGFKELVQQLEVAFGQTGYNLRAAAQPQQSTFRWAFFSGGSTTTTGSW